MKRIALLTIILAIFTASNLLAQQFEVTPSKMMFQIEPGNSGTAYITVINKSNTKRSYIIETSDWTVDQSGKIEYVDIFPKRTCQEWMNITPAFFDLGPNETEKIAINMNVPDTALATKWAMLFVREAIEQTSAMAADKELKTGITISPSIAVYVFQTPQSNNAINATVQNLSKYEAAEDTTQKVQAMVTNSCDRILECKVFLEIVDLQTAEEISVEAVEALVLPGVTKPFIITLPDGLAAGSYDITALLDYGNDAELVATQMLLEIE